MAYIDIEGLNYCYPDEKRPALKDISVSIEKGDIVFVVGRSGSGKSTLGKVIAGSIPHFYGGNIGGRVLISGSDVKFMQQGEIARKVTMVFQDPERQLVMNKVHREIAFGLENLAIESREIKRRVWEAMQFTNTLDFAFRDINTLSGGEKQKVAIAAAVSYMPECIVLDEPTSQLDPAASEEIVSLVKKINEELGITIIIIEQRIDRWFDIADRVLQMEEGRVDFYGTKEEFYNEIRCRSFLPSYLRLAQDIGLPQMPESFKAMRNILRQHNYPTKTQKKNMEQYLTECMEVDKLKIYYDDVPAVKGIGIMIYEGEFISLLGANGAGKSTLLRAMMGLQKYDGSLKLYSKEVKKLKTRDIARTVGYVSQNPNDYISRDSVYEEIKFTLDNHNIKDEKAIENVMEKLHIQNLRNKNPRDLSGGEKQRVAIASILVTHPKVLILDEPTRGLDIEVKRSLGTLLKELNDEGTTIILVTHDVEFAAEFSNRFLLMFNGDIVCDGNAEEVMSNGIYYTTNYHKLFKEIDSGIFNLRDVQELIRV